MQVGWVNKLFDGGLGKYVDGLGKQTISRCSRQKYRQLLTAMICKTFPQIKPLEVWVVARKTQHIILLVVSTNHDFYYFRHVTITTSENLLSSCLVGIFITLIMY